MDLQEFRKDFIENVKIESKELKDGSNSSFVKLACEKLIELEVIDEYEECFYKNETKKRKKYRIDAYDINELENTVTLIISQFDIIGEEVILTKTNTKKIFDKLQTFLEEALQNNLKSKLDISTSVYNLTEYLNEKIQDIRKFRYIILTDQILSDRINDIESGEYKGKKIEYHIWDIRRFYENLTSEVGSKDLEINLKEYDTKGIKFLEVNEVSNSEYQCFLCIISGKMLADIYDKYGSLLLEGNVRSFLSVKGEVNKSIRNTILDPSKSSLFFALNNGIAATANGIEIEQIQGENYITKLKNLQIVNGGQTTASLSNTRFKDKVDLKNIYVQMKLTTLNFKLSQELIPQISKASNTQNKVSIADLESNRRFQIEFEKISRTKYAPAVNGAQYETHWFYERARGQYIQQQMKMTKSERNKFELKNPKKQVISKTDLAKVVNTWRKLPHQVSRGAQTNFVEFASWITKQWEEDNTLCSENFFEKCAGLLILFKNAEKLVTEQEWYEKGYRANIVTYSLALLHHTIQKQYPEKILDLEKIWNKQKVPSIIEEQMKELTKKAFEIITDPNRETINVTQWCKRKECWARFLKLDISLLPEIQQCLREKSGGIFDDTKMLE